MIEMQELPTNVFYEQDRNEWVDGYGATPVHELAADDIRSDTWQVEGTLRFGRHEVQVVPSVERVTSSLLQHGLVVMFTSRGVCQFRWVPERLELPELQDWVEVCHHFESCGA